MAEASAKADPGLTIVVLTRNRRDLLRGCLESLVAQDDPGVPMRVIVVDDGSTDGTGEMVNAWTAARPHWQYIRQAHQGIAAARNAGIRRSRSAWTAIVADDYLLPPEYAMTIAAFFNAQPQAQVLRFKIVPAGNDFLGLALHAYLEASIIRRLAPQGSMMSLRGFWRKNKTVKTITKDHDLEAAGAAAFRSDVFQKIGGFDESFIRGEDTEFTRRLRAAGIPVFYSPQPPIRHRNDIGLGPAMKNAYRSGCASWRLHAAPKEKPPTIFQIFLLALRTGPAILYWATWRARQTGRLTRFFAYFPVLLLMEASSRTGFFYAGVSSLKKLPAGSGGPLPE
jgi:GT2 family glycosyltransferase